MLCYNIEQYDTSPHVSIRMKANNFVVVVFTVLFDSNSLGADFDTSSTQRFHSKEAVESMIFR